MKTWRSALMLLQLRTSPGFQGPSQSNGGGGGGEGGEDGEQPGWACDAVGPKKGRPGEGETSGRGHTLVDVRGNICAKQQRVAPSPACPPRRLGPVAPSGAGAGAGEGGLFSLVTRCCSLQRVLASTSDRCLVVTQNTLTSAATNDQWGWRIAMCLLQKKTLIIIHTVCVVVFCCVFWITLMLIVFIVLIL